MTEAKGEGGERFYLRGRSDQRDMKQGRGSPQSKSRGRGSKLRFYICNSEEHLKQDYAKECRVQGTGKVRVQIRDGSSFVLDNVKYVSKLKRNLISLGTIEKESFIVKLWSGMIKVIKGLMVVLLMQSSYDFNNKFYNSLGRAHNRCSVVR
nr:zinc finger, CCHC-type [Tanacetum cinerariifolium]